MSTFAKLKARSKSNNVQDLQSRFMSSGGGNRQNVKPDNLWKLEGDKAGNGMAVIRFLPEPEGEELSQVFRYYNYIAGPGGKYYNVSPATIEEKCPVYEYRGQLMRQGASDDELRKFGRNKKFYSNIYVEKDPANPSNEGKVFLFEYGAKVAKMLENAVKPAFADELPFDPFSPFSDGRSFRFVGMNLGTRNANYDTSSFLPAESLGGGQLSDEEIEKIWKQCHSLNDLIAPTAFKPYAELKRQFNRVMGLEDVSFDTVPTQAPKKESTNKVVPDAPVSNTTVKDTPATSTTSDDDDILSMLDDLDLG